MSAPTGWVRVDELPGAWRVVDTSGTVRPLTFTGPAARHLADVAALALNAAAECGGPSSLIDARERWLPVAAMFTAPTTNPGTQRWAPLCQHCYQSAVPDQYVPELTSYGECAVCGESGLIVNAHPEVFRAAVSNHERSTR